MKYQNDDRVVMTLDAGGTNFVFSATRGNKQIVDEIIISAAANDLDKCMVSIVSGFKTVNEKLESDPVSISIAFPGPADYPNGIIGDLPNLPAFRGGVALGPMLEDKFGLPVFINNDGDLYAYGESLCGFLPYINDLLEKAGNPRRYRNLLGLTLGTGFGAGIVRDDRLFLGDNSSAAGIWLLRNKLMPISNIEEHVSKKGLRTTYAMEANIPIEDVPEPKDIFEIGIGTKEGNQYAAVSAFKIMAEAAGDTISNTIALIDGLIVIGGGLSGAAELFLPHMVNEMNSQFTKSDGSKLNRLSAKTFNLENRDELDEFLNASLNEIVVYGTDKKVKYDPNMKIGIGISKIGSSNAISLGAYTFALKNLDEP